MSETDRPVALGQRVMFTETLRRGYKPASPRSKRVWESTRYWLAGNSKGPVEGILMGVRTLSDGEVEDGYYDTPSVYYPKRTFTAYLIAHDLRRKPVLVLPEHVYWVSE